MRARNRKHKPKFATKTKIKQFFGTSFLYVIMKPKIKHYSTITKKNNKSFDKKLIWSEHGGWF